MKQPNFFLKLSAAVSSILLASGYVAYSAGALNWLTSEVAEQERPEMFSSSKVRALVPATKLAAPQPVPIEPPSYFMGGSKSAVPLVSPPMALPINAEQTVTPQTPFPANHTALPQPIMVGSKSPAVQPLISPPPQSTNNSKMPSKQQYVPK